MSNVKQFKMPDGSVIKVKDEEARSVADTANNRSIANADNLNIQVSRLDGRITQSVRELQDEIDDVHVPETLVDQVNGNSADISVLEGRMDEFTRLPEGSTAGDAELADIRISRNGVVFETAGDAVRSQANEVVTIRTSGMNTPIIEGQYANRGGFVNLAGWSRTDYLYVGDISYMDITMSNPNDEGRYIITYDSNKDFMYDYVCEGELHIQFTEDEKFIVISNTDEAMATLSISKEFESADNIKGFASGFGKAVIEKAENGKLDITLTAKQISVGSTVDPASKRQCMTPIYRVGNTQNKIHMVIPSNNLSAQCLTYKMGANGEPIYFEPFHSFGNEDTYWLLNDVMFISFRFERNDNGLITKEDIAEICANFSAIALAPIDNYLRVCTFNEAQNYPAFNSTDPVFIKKQIEDYHRLLGDINADILGEQEARQYMSNQSTAQGFASNCLAFKYNFLMPLWGDHLRLSSKFGTMLNRGTSKIYNTNYPDKTRYYIKIPVSVNGKIIMVYVTHCEWEGDFDLYRKNQFIELREAMKLDEYAIALGDFNADDITEYDVFNQEGGNFKFANGGEFGVFDTWNHTSEGWHNKATSNIIVSSNLVLQNVFMGDMGTDAPLPPAQISDHRPLVADIKIL